VFLTGTALVRRRVIYNIFIVNIDDALTLPDGPERTASLVAWLQGLYEDEASIPVLVGGAAVELLTGGGYTTGDLDFVGEVPDTVARKLSEAGFKRKGRHWIHQEGQVFLEFAGGSLEADEEVIALDVAGQRIRVLAPEAVLVDRLASWQFWGSTTDGVNAFLILRATSDQMDLGKLERLVEARDVSRAWALLDAFNRRFATGDPTAKELSEWAESLES
jgi:hypothetical protein